MNTYRLSHGLVSFILVSVAVISVNAKTLKKEKTVESDKDQIIEIVNKMSLAMAQGNLDAAMATYEPGATLVAQPGVLVTGSAFREAMNGYVSMKPKFDMPKHEVIESGDIALHLSPWVMEAVDPKSGNPVKQSGFSIAVFRKQKDGKWLMVIDNPHGGNLLSK
jgi:ketosteroid isomerase-like protein